MYIITTTAPAPSTCPATVEAIQGASSIAYAIVLFVFIAWAIKNA